VKEWMGHDKVTTTEGYVMYAKRYYYNASYDWIKAILKFHTKTYDVEQENGLNSKTPLKTFVSTGNNRSGEVCSRREGFSVSPVRVYKLDPLFALSVHSTSLTKPLLLSFFHVKGLAIKDIHGKLKISLHTII